MFAADALLTWTYQGRRVDMGEAYREELDRIIATHGVLPSRLASVPAQVAAPTRLPCFPIGAIVRIVADGPMHDVIGEVEAAFPTRSQVRVGDDLYAVPNDLLQVAQLLAS